MSEQFEERESDETRRWTRSAPPERDSTPDPHHVTDTVPFDYHRVPGWGLDLDPKNRPMVPMELPSDVQTARGEVRDWQVPHDKVHVSIEHPNLTPVFGTSCPPRGLSGMLRNYAFGYSEGTNRHWMTLLIADRIDVVEHLFGDALRGKPDRYIKEKGWSAHVKYGEPPHSQRNYFALGMAVVGAVVVGAMVSRALADE